MGRKKSNQTNKNQEKEWKKGEQDLENFALINRVSYFKV